MHRGLEENESNHAWPKISPRLDTLQIDTGFSCAESDYKSISIKKKGCLKKKKLKKLKK
jgi:hypothetical protein